MSKAFNQPEPVFQSVVVPAAKPPPGGTVDNTQFLFEPALTDQPVSLHQQQLTNPLATVHQQPFNWPQTDNRRSTTDQTHTDQVTKHVPSTSIVDV